MSRHQRPGSVCLPRGFVAVSVFGAGVLFAMILHDAGPRTIAGNVHPIALIPAVVPAPSTRPQAGSPAARAMRIDVDSMHSCSPDQAVLRRVGDYVASYVWIDGAGQTAVPEDRVAACVNWARLTGTPSPLRADPSPMADSLDAYAVHSREGATVIMSNRGTVTLTITLDTRLRRAPYKIERLSVGPHVTGPRAAMASAQASDAQIKRVLGDFRLMRLKGRDLTNTDVVTMPIVVLPGEVAMLRFSDTAYASRIALKEVRAQLRRLPAASRDLAQRLHVVFDGTGSCESAIAEDCRLGADRRRTDIHRFLLVLGQAYSLLRNYQVSKAVKAGPGTEFRAALDRLNDSLADVSATLMGLVPGVSLSGEPPASAQPIVVEGPANDESGEGSTRTAYATITLSNQGSRSVELVKIGMDKAGLDTGVRCVPADPALFGTLAPGETARAVYRLQWNAGAAPKGCCAGDISYFTAGAPAHLRPRTWQ